ncbi:MAG: App1 family protein [Planctomycetota bacterium]
MSKTVGTCLLLSAILLTGESQAQIKADEEVVFYPTYGCRAVGDACVLRIHGCIFEPEKDSPTRAAALGALRKALGLNREVEETAIFKERARLFLVDSERGKHVTIRLAGKEYKLGESEPNGHFTGEVRVPEKDVLNLLESRGDTQGWLPFHAVMSEGDRRAFTGHVQWTDDTGISVISDIDDTIKISEVLDRKALLRNTFLKEFAAVPGMAEVYGRWTKDGAVFHYVSASPWQLYKIFAEFIRKSGYPPGAFHLKEFNWRVSSFLSLFDSPEEAKRTAIEPILAAFPARRFIFVGDSGEKDPEIYGALARRHPRQLFHILIRNVTGEAPDAERFRAAFNGVPRERWTVFSLPSQILTGPFYEP